MQRSPESPSNAQVDVPRVSALTAALARVCSRPDLRLTCAWLFGSEARGEAGPLSDVDVAVLFEAGVEPSARFELAAIALEEAERAIGQSVDLVILNEAAPVVRHRVIRDGALLYSRDERDRVNFEAMTLNEYLDFQPVLARFDRVLFSRAREGRLGTR